MAVINPKREEMLEKRRERTDLAKKQAAERMEAPAVRMAGRVHVHMGTPGRASPTRRKRSRRSRK